LEYHIAGADELKKNARVQIPVTQPGLIPALVHDYYSVPQIKDQIGIRIHSSYVWRRLLIAGLLPALFIIPLLWWRWEEIALYFLFYPAIVGIIAWQSQKKFRLWALNDIAYIKKGWFGEERIVVQWYKLQSVHLKQSIFQRRKNLATVVIHTAGGSINIPFIELDAAKELVNFSLYKTEVSDKPWM